MDSQKMLEMMDKGYSAREIGEKAGISRSAVIGRVWRLRKKNADGQSFVKIMQRTALGETK